MEDPRTQVVLCLSSGDGEGCHHPVSWHTGPTTLAPNCDCCSWRKGRLAAQAQANPGQVRIPAPAGFSPDKWAAMPRRERRKAMKGRRK